MRLQLLVSCLLLLPSCRTGCDGPLGGLPKVGHEETRVFVTCDPSGYTVRNEGKLPRSLLVNPSCTINSGQVTIGPHGELPDLVIYPASGSSPTPLSATIGPGQEKRVELDMSTVSHCMDATMAPPGQHENEPVSLVSDGPADALRIRFAIHEMASMDPPARIDVACKW